MDGRRSFEGLAGNSGLSLKVAQVRNTTIITRASGSLLEGPTERPACGSLIPAQNPRARSQILRHYDFVANGIVNQFRQRMELHLHHNSSTVRFDRP